MLWHVALSWLGKIENRVKLAFNVLHVLIQRRPHLWQCTNAILSKCYNHLLTIRYLNELIVSALNYIS